MRVFHLSFVRAFHISLVRDLFVLLWHGFFQALSLFYHSKFAILVGMPMPQFLRSCLIVGGDIPDFLNFDIRPLRYCNGPFVASLYWPFVASGFFG